MQAVEFKAKIKNGMIIVPEKHRKTLKENVGKVTWGAFPWHLTRCLK